MNLKLVYRALRKISDLTINGYYSEVHVEGQENVPKNGPVIIAANHHNEILDVATLSITIPHGRHVSFWAKSSLFGNPILKQILESSGAIPVERNPNSADGFSKAALFKSSTLALARGEVIGVFPEGTSYTEPRIVQLMSGNAWAAVEYMRWRRNQHGDEKPSAGDLVIIPVGIVYTKKTTFGSRVRVQYGVPIAMADYAQELFDVPDDASPDDIAYKVVRKITERMEAQLFMMTINADDWETLYAAETLRSILFEDQRKIALRDWTGLTQKLINLLSNPAPSEPIQEVKSSLIKYHSLLHYSGLSHSDLPWIPHLASRLRFLFNLAAPSFSSILLAPIHLPLLLLHIPACISAELLRNAITKKNEPETWAEARAIGGGIGMRVAMSLLLSKIKWDVVLDWLSRRVELPSVVSRIRGSWVGRTIAYWVAGSVTMKTYVLFAPGLHSRLKKAIMSFRVLMGILPPRPAIDVAPYTILPPPPPSNGFIRRHGNSAGEFWDRKEKEQLRMAPPPIARRKLVRAVIKQREETMKVVMRHDDIVALLS